MEIGERTDGSPPLPNLFCWPLPGGHSVTTIRRDLVISIGSKAQTTPALREVSVQVRGKHFPTAYKVWCIKGGIGTSSVTGETLLELLQSNLLHMLLVLLGWALSSLKFSFRCDQDLEGCWLFTSAEHKKFSSGWPTEHQSKTEYNLLSSLLPRGF